MSESRYTDAATRRGVHDRLAGLPSAPGVDLRRTLKLRVELLRQLRRRRTQIVLAILVLLPVIIALAFEVGGAGNSADAPALVGLATTGASNFALFTEYASVGFLLVVIVALFCGDTVSSEATWSSLRSLLALPVPRGRLLRQKLTIALLLSLVANVLLPAWALVVGGVFFGWSPAQSPTGATFSSSTSIARLAVVVAYVCVQLLLVAAFAFLLGTYVDNPLGAVGGAVMLVVVSTILDSITALDPYRVYLPTHWQFSWIDALNTPIRWDDMLRGVGSSLAYTAVFLAVAFVHFDRKDVTS